MSRVHLISTEGSYLEAEIDIEFSLLFDNEDKWENIFLENPDNKIGLEHMSGWTYRAYGNVVSINPVVVDCGLFQVEDVIDSNDPKIIGASVIFTINRLGGLAAP